MFLTSLGAEVETKSTTGARVSALSYIFVSLRETRKEERLMFWEQSKHEVFL